MKYLPQWNVTQVLRLKNFCKYKLFEMFQSSIAKTWNLLKVLDLTINERDLFCSLNGTILFYNFVIEKNFPTHFSQMSTLTSLCVCAHKTPFWPLNFFTRNSREKGILTHRVLYLELTSLNFKLNFSKCLISMYVFIRSQK